MRRQPHLMALTLTVVALAGCGQSAVGHPAVRGGSASPSSRPTALVTKPPTARAAAAAVRADALHWQLPRSLSREVVLALGGRLLVAGGLAADKTSTSTVYLVDLHTGHVQPAGALAKPLHDASGAVVGGAAYVFGGGAATTIAAVQRIAVGGTAGVVASLPQPRSDLVAVAVGSRAVVLGGYDGTTTTSTVLSTADGRRFDTVARLPFGVRYPAVAAVGDSVYLLGGEHAGAPIDSIQRVDLARGTATVVGHLPQPLAHACAGTIGGRIVVAGGRSGGTTTDRVLVLDPASGRVVVTARLQRPVADAGCAVLDDALWLLGGETPATIATVQRVSVG